MSFIIKIATGAAAGAAAGFLIGRSPVCGSGNCDARPSRWASLIAATIFGAAAGYWWAIKTG